MEILSKLVRKQVSNLKIKHKDQHWDLFSILCGYDWMSCRVFWMQIWRLPKLWPGFLKCVSQTKPHSFPVLLEVQENVVEEYTSLVYYPKIQITLWCCFAVTSASTWKYHEEVSWSKTFPHCLCESANYQIFSTKVGLLNQTDTLLSCILSTTCQILNGDACFNSSALSVLGLDNGQDSRSQMHPSDATSSIHGAALTWLSLEEYRQVEVIGGDKAQMIRSCVNGGRLATTRKSDY